MAVLTAKAGIFFVTAAWIGAMSYAEIREDKKVSRRTLQHWVVAMIVTVGAPTIGMMG